MNGQECKAARKRMSALKQMIGRRQAAISAARVNISEFTQEISDLRAHLRAAGYVVKA